MTADVGVASRQFVEAANRLPVLYELTAEFKTLVDLLEQPNVDQDAVSEELARVATDIKAKAFGIAVVLQGMGIKASALKDDEARLAAKRKALEAAAERLKAYTLQQMQVLGEDRIDTGTFLLTVRANPGRIEVTDAARVPPEFQRTVITTTVNKTAVMDAYKRDGVLVPGTEVVKSDRLAIS